MTLPRFEYVAPRSVQEACSFMAQHKGEALAMTGGTDLLPKMKDRVLTPRYVVGLRSIAGLDYVKRDEKGLTIGALATLAQVAESSAVLKDYPLLAEAILKVASVQVRNIGTIAGNLCNASPSADTAPALMVMGARLKIGNVDGQSRVIPVEDLFTGPGKTVLTQGELLEEIQVPPPLPGSGGAYWKLSLRRAMDLATVGVGCFLTLDGKKCLEARIALGAVAPTPIRAKGAEDLVRGASLSADLLEKASAAAMSASRPITDIRSTADYRRKMVGVLTRKAISQAWERAAADK